jgi:hypothetical protein
MRKQYIFLFGVLVLAVAGVVTVNALLDGANSSSPDIDTELAGVSGVTEPKEPGTSASLGMPAPGFEGVDEMIVLEDEPGFSGPQVGETLSDDREAEPVGEPIRDPRS